MQRHHLIVSSLFDLENEIDELLTWDKISSTTRGLSSVKISSRFDNSLLRYCENRMGAPSMLVALQTMILDLFLWCRIFGAHLHFIRYYRQTLFLTRSFSQRYCCHICDIVIWSFNILKQRCVLGSWCLLLFQTIVFKNFLSRYNL